jgi:stage V sporulation protein G
MGALQVDTKIHLSLPAEAGVTLAITNVQVYPIKEPEKLLGYARVVLGDCLQLTGLRIVQGHDHIFIGYPNDPDYKGGDYKSIYYPVTRVFRDRIEEAVVFKYLLVTGREIEVGDHSYSLSARGVIMRDGVALEEEEAPRVILELQGYSDATRELLAQVIRSAMK